MRIVMVAACPYPTTQGTQVYIRGMTRALVDGGHEVHLVTYHFGEDLGDEAAIIHRIPPVPWYRKLRAGPSWSKPLLDSLLAWKLLEVVREQRPDLVHAHNYEAPLAAYLVRSITGVPVLYNSHNLMQDELHLYLKGRARRAAARRFGVLLDRQVPRRADRCIVISQAAGTALAALGVPKERIHFLAPAVHADEFEDLERRPGSQPTVLYAGNPDRYQDLHVLLRAMARVVSEQPSVRLRVVSSAELGEVAELALREGLPERNLELHTESSWKRVRSLMATADLAALPRTLCRGFPIKLLNYMAVGLPVVACAGSAALIEEGINGRVVPNGDHEAFASAILELLADSATASRMGEAARSSVLAEHSWSRRLPQLEAIYGAMLGE